MEMNLPSGGGDMSGGARVRSILNEFLVDFTHINITADMSDDDIDRAIRMHEGDSLPGFPSPDTFEYLALPHLQKIAIPAAECVHNVAAALDLLAQRMAQAVFRRFPKLGEVALEMVQNIIQREKDAARLIVEQQVMCHTGYLFTNDPHYLTDHGSMEPMYKNAQQPKPPPPAEEEKDPTMAQKTVQSVRDNSKAAYQSVQNMVSKAPPRDRQRYSGPYVTEIRKRLDSYFALMIRNVRDSIPKAIGFYLVRQVQDRLQFELLNALNQPGKVSELLGEPPHIMEERKSLSTQLRVLQKATNVLTRDPTLASIALEAELEIAEPAPQQVPTPRGAGSITTAHQPAAPVQRAGSLLGGAPKPATTLFGAPKAPTAKPGLFEDDASAKRNTAKTLFGE